MKTLPTLYLEELTDQPQKQHNTWPGSCGGKARKWQEPYPLPPQRPHAQSSCQSGQPHAPLKLETWPGNPQKMEAASDPALLYSLYVCPEQRSLVCGVCFQLGRSIRLHSLENREGVERNRGKELRV